MEAAAAIRQALRWAGFQNPTVTVQLVRFAAIQDISREYTVAPDGVVKLSRFGAVNLAGKTVTEARLAIQDHLAQFFDLPLVGVSVVGYNSKTYYVITAEALAGETIQRFPVTGNETVLDAIGQVKGMSAGVRAKRCGLRGPASGDCQQDQVLPVDWDAITAGGETKTNYQILPGDRLYIVDDSLVAANNYIGFFTDPISRLLNISVLGTSTTRNAQTLGRPIQPESPIRSDESLPWRTSDGWSSGAGGIAARTWRRTPQCVDPKRGDHRRGHDGHGDCGGPRPARSAGRHQRHDPTALAHARWQRAQSAHGSIRREGYPDWLAWCERQRAGTSARQTGTSVLLVEWRRPGQHDGRSCRGGAVRPGAGIDCRDPVGEATAIRPVAGSSGRPSLSLRRTRRRFPWNGWPTAFPRRPNSADCTSSTPCASARWSRSYAAERTSGDTIATAVAHVRRIGRMAIVVEDGPGFVVNRLLFPYLGAGLELLREGVPAEAIEGAAADFGMAIGPLRLMDEIGLDTTLQAGWVLAAAFPERIAPSPLLVSMIKAGRLGRKTGAGFFAYPRPLRRRGSHSRLCRKRRPKQGETRMFAPPNPPSTRPSGN